METMDDFKEELEASFRRIKEGDIISGTVIGVNEEEVTLDKVSQVLGNDMVPASTSAFDVIGKTVQATTKVKDKDGKLYEYNTVKGKYVKEVTKDGKQKYESSVVTKGKEFVNKWLNKNKKK